MVHLADKKWSMQRTCSEVKPERTFQGLIILWIKFSPCLKNTPLNNPQFSWTFDLNIYFYNQRKDDRKLTVEGRLFNPLTPMSDQDRVSPYNIGTISTRKVMRIKKNINYEIISWSNTKFFKLTSQELHGRQ